MIKRYRIRRLEEKTAGLSAEYSELLRISKTLTEMSQYEIDKMAGLKKIIAEFEYRLSIN